MKTELHDVFDLFRKLRMHSRAKFMAQALWQMTPSGLGLREKTLNNDNNKQSDNFFYELHLNYTQANYENKHKLVQIK